MSLAKLFEQISSEVLTEDVKIQLSALFESRVNEAIKVKETQMEKKNRREIAEFKENLVNQVDEYLHYFTEEYVRENKQAIVESAKVSQATKVLGLMTKFVNDFNVALAPVNENAVKDSQRIRDLQKELNGRVNESIRQTKRIEQLKREKMIVEKSLSLGSSEREKFLKLTESVKFEDETSFGKKLNAIASVVKTPISKKVVKMTESRPAVKMERKVVREIEKKTETPDTMSKYLEKLA